MLQLLRRAPLAGKLSVLDFSALSISASPFVTDQSSSNPEADQAARPDQQPLVAGQSTLTPLEQHEGAGPIQARSGKGYEDIVKSAKSGGLTSSKCRLTPNVKHPRNHVSDPR